MTRMQAGYLSLTGLTLAFAAETALACRHEAPRNLEVSADGISVVEIVATSGGLQIHGREGLARIVVDGIACTNDEDRLPEIRIQSQRVDDRLRIVAEVPYEPGKDWRIGHLDLAVSLPPDVPVELSDSSGDMEISDIAAITLSDSSGDIDLQRVTGKVLILRDSSGDITMRDVGPAIIQVDSSGEIDVQGAESMVVDVDTSGDIRISKVRGDVSVGTDSSGGIFVSEIGGDFSVADDSSGGIRYRAVAGNVSIPSERR